MKLNVQSKWLDTISNSLKTAVGYEDKGGDPTKEGHAPDTHVPMNRGRKWEVGKEKREGMAAKMMEKFKIIVVKRKEAKKDTKAERFDMFMDMQNNMFKLEKTKIAIKAEAEA